MTGKTIHLVVSVFENSPWSQYLAKSVLAQNLAQDERILRCTVVSGNAADHSAQKFAEDMRKQMTVETVVVDSYHTGFEIIRSCCTGTEDFVAIASGAGYWIDAEKLRTQIDAIYHSNADFAWHPQLVRNTQTQGIQPGFEVWGSNRVSRSSNTLNVPWTSLLIQKQSIADYEPHLDTADLAGFRSQLVKRFTGILVPKVFTIRQNSAGRGPIQISMPNYVQLWRERRSDDVDWQALILGGDFANGNIQDAINNLVRAEAELRSIAESQHTSESAPSMVQRLKAAIRK